MEIFLLGVIVGGLVVWGYNKYLNTPMTLEEALVIAETEVKTTLDVNNDGKVNVEDAKAVVRRPRKKAGTAGTDGTAQ
jgi:hypothetical protein